MPPEITLGTIRHSLEPNGSMTWNSFPGVWGFAFSASYMKEEEERWRK
jgi:hypothetical protein